MKINCCNFPNTYCIFAGGVGMLVWVTLISGARERIPGPTGTEAGWDGQPPGRSRGAQGGTGCEYLFFWLKIKNIKYKFSMCKDIKYAKTMMLTLIGKILYIFSILSGDTHSFRMFSFDHAKVHIKSSLLTSFWKTLFPSLNKVRVWS